MMDGYNCGMDGGIDLTYSGPRTSSTSCVESEWWTCIWMYIDCSKKGT